MTSDQPPIAKRIPRKRSHHGDTVVDEYAWLSDKDDPDTIAYLEAENAFTAAATAHLADLRATLFEEIKSRTKETDLSVPVRKGKYWYYGRTEEGKQYGIYCRRAVDPGEVDPPLTEDGTPLLGEEVLLDSNVLAGDSAFFALGTCDTSPDGRLLAYSTDFSGDERFTLRVNNLETGQVLPDEIPNAHYGSAWSADGSTVFYLTIDEAWRPCRVWRHALGTPTTEDVLVYEESDERFWVGVGLTRSEQFIVIDCHSKVTSEVRVIPAEAPAAEPRIVTQRRQGVEYSVDHYRGDPGEPGVFLVLHNDGAEDFALATTPASDPGPWTPLIPHTAGTRLNSVDVFSDHLVVSLRHQGMTGLRVFRFDGARLDAGYDIRFPEPLHTVGPDSNPEYATTTFRLGYTSLVTPGSVYDCDLVSGELTLRKQQPVLGDFDPRRYDQVREWATAADGARVPISIVFRKEVARDGQTPCVLYGYGSYEASMDPWFSVARLSLLDRGVAFAVAHVRGGGEMGRHWYEQGKMLAKQTTFTDFVTCATHLVEAGWCRPERLIARGGSAGGLLMGAVANLAPEAFGGIVAQVPFVDALTSILDPSLPLTVTEWEEWGNPLDDPAVYATMKSYTPYENVTAKRYPPILAMTSINDTRVAYHEPAKWVARLRATAIEPDALLKTEMGAGHGGPSGRYDSWREEAFVLAWILDRLGLASAVGK
ncbi:MAG: S9 family peptidase [Micromonosporaceae bacterium]|nr:S9 family peptidase [Micromonosporaceae bacterium]